MAAEQEKRAWWRRPITWIGGIVIAALGIAITNALVPFFSSLITPLTEQGPPVDVLDATEYRSAETGQSTVFARGTAFTQAEIDDLNAQEDTVPWLESRGGVPITVVYARVVLEGNRNDAVRIVDARTAQDCAEPLDGTLFLNPPGGAEEAVRMDFDLDEPDPVATTRTEDGTVEPFFPARTISLAEDEQIAIVVTGTTLEQYCTFRVVLSVLQGDELTEVEVPEPDAPPFAVTAKLEDETRYEAVYLGGVICDLGRFIIAGPAYFAGDFDRSHICVE